MKLMGKAWSIFLMICIAWSCQDESYLRLQNTPATSGFIGSYSSPQQYYSETDTIILYVLQDHSTYPTVATSISSGSTGNFDRVEAQRRTLVIGSDSLPYRFYFSINSYYNPSRPSLVEDSLSISMEDQAGEVASLGLIFSDSLHCFRPSCRYSDSTMVDSLIMREVFYLDRDTTQAQFYYNSTRGIEAFRTSGQQFYKRR